MASNRDTFTTEIYVNNEQAQDALAELTKKMDTLNDKYDKLAERNKKLAEKTAEAKDEMDKTTESLKHMTKGTEEYAKTAKLLDKQTKAYNNLTKELEKSRLKTAQTEKEMKSMKSSIENAKKGTDNFARAMENLSGKSMKSLLDMQRKLKSELDKTKPNTAEWNKLSKSYQDVTSRIKSLSDAQNGVTTGLGKLTSGAGGLLGKLGSIGSIITALPTMFKGLGLALNAIVGVTKEVINASQTMSDKWNNGMVTMKTTTDAFFKALSSGNWDAFNDGILTALKNAREYAEVLDQFGSQQIASRYVNTKYGVQYQEGITAASDASLSKDERKAGINQAQNAIDEMNKQAERTADQARRLIKQTLRNSGLQVPEEELDNFIEHFYKDVIAGYDEAVSKISGEIDMKARKKHLGQALQAYLNPASIGGLVIDYFRTEKEALNEGLKGVDETTALYVKAFRGLTDDQQIQLLEWMESADQQQKSAEQMTKRLNSLKNTVEKGDDSNKYQYDEEIKALEKAFETEKNLLKQRYANNEISEKKYQAEMEKAETEYLNKKLAAARKYGQDETAIMSSILNKQVENKKASQKENEEAFKREMAVIDKNEKNQLIIIKQQYANGLMDKERYEAEKTRIQADYLKARYDLTVKYGKDGTAYLNQILDQQIKSIEYVKSLLKDEAAEVEEYNNETPSSYSGAAQGENNGINDQKAYDDFQEAIWQKAADIRKSITEQNDFEIYEAEMKWAEKLAEDGKITAEEAEKYKYQIRLKYGQKAAQAAIDMADKVANAVAAFKDMELAKAEATYQAELTAAGDNATAREEAEQNYNQKKLEITKKYANVEMTINIAKAIASGALAIMQAFAQLGPIGGAIAAVLVAATTAAEVATIVQQRNAIMAQTLDSSGGSSQPVGQRTLTGYSSGGYTDKDGSDSKPVGVVHANEYVAPAWMVRKNPVLFADLERYRLSGSNGRSGNSRRGFADGGFADAAQAGQNAYGGQQLLTEATGQLILAAVQRDTRAWVALSDIEAKQKTKNKFKAATGK